MDFRELNTMIRALMEQDHSHWTEAQFRAHVKIILDASHELEADTDLEFKEAMTRMED